MSGINTNRSLMQAKEMNLRKDLKRLKVEAGVLAEHISSNVNTALYDIEDMDIATAAAEMDRLVLVQAEILSIQTKLASLESALYG